MASSPNILFPADMVAKVMNHIPRPRYRARVGQHNHFLDQERKQDDFSQQMLNEMVHYWTVEIVILDPPRPEFIMAEMPLHLPFPQTLLEVSAEQLLNHLRNTKPQGYATWKFQNMAMCVRDGMVQFQSSLKGGLTPTRWSIPWSEELMDDLYCITASMVARVKNFAERKEADSIRKSQEFGMNE